jgi:hypothetical protein
MESVLLEYCSPHTKIDASYRIGLFDAVLLRSAQDAHAGELAAIVVR